MTSNRSSHFGMTLLAALLASVLLGACSSGNTSTPNPSSTSGSSSGTGSGTGSGSGSGSGSGTGSGSSSGSGSGSGSGSSSGSSGTSGSEGTGTDGGGADGGDLDAQNGQCAFVGPHWSSGLGACPGSSGGLCTNGYEFGADGCFASEVCVTDAQFNVRCKDVKGHWTQTGCSTVTVAACDGSTSTLTVQGPGADGSLKIDGASYTKNGSAQTGCSCADASAGDAGADGASAPSNFLGTPPWSGTEVLSLVCGDAGMFRLPQSLSGISFMPTASGFSYTDTSGCMFDFAVSGNTATLVAPVTCMIHTDSGTQTEYISSATLTSSDGHHLTGQFTGTDTEGTLACSITASLTLNR
jgi:hypothetical protein